MSNYIKATNFFAKDALLTGNPDKIIKGAEIDAEYNAIATSIATKANLNSPNFTGTPTVPTAPSNTNTTQVASTAFVQNIASTLGTMSTQDDNTVAITGGSIAGITDLAVADGGTGASTLTGVVIGNGTSAMTAVVPSTSGNVLTSNGTTWASSPATGLGVNQTWQSLTANRALGTTYTNTTGKPIMVYCHVAGTGRCDITLNDVYIGQFQANASFVNGNASFIVPANHTYLITGAANLASWSELR